MRTRTTAAVALALVTAASLTACFGPSTADQVIQIADEWAISDGERPEGCEQPSAPNVSAEKERVWGEVEGDGPWRVSLITGYHEASGLYSGITYVTVGADGDGQPNCVTDWGEITDVRETPEPTR